MGQPADPARRAELRQWIDNFDAQDLALFAAGFNAPAERVQAAPGFPLACTRLGHCLEASFEIAPAAVRQSLVETLVLNPNADVDANGLLVVAPAHKGFLLEFLVKTLVGNCPELTAASFHGVAECVSNGTLFADQTRFPIERILTPVPEERGREKGDRAGNYWAADREARPDMGARRRHWWQAEHNLIGRLLREYALGAGPNENLEVGAGWGDFHWMAPDWFREHLVSVEWNPNYVREFQRRFPAAVVRRGNIYALDIASESVANVVGLTPFSSLWNLDQGFAELWRVLKPGGRLFSFQDLMPNDPQVVEQLLKRGLMPNPTGVIFCRTGEDREAVREALMRGGRRFGDEAWKEYKRAMHRLTVVENLYEYHEQWMVTELKFRGFRILHGNDDREVFVGPRNERHRRLCGQCPEDHNRDIALFAFGNPRGPFREPHSGAGAIPARLLGEEPGDVVEKAIVWTIVAEKPCA